MTGREEKDYERGAAKSERDEIKRRIKSTAMSLNVYFFFNCEILLENLDT